MFYSIRHLTKFLYTNPVSESMMETRMHPRSDQNQRCLTFHLSVSPRCRVFSYRDHLGNHVHHFDIPGQHGQLVIVAESLVEMQPRAAGAGVPRARCLGRARRAWSSRAITGRCCCPASSPRPRRRWTRLPSELDVRRRDDPLMRAARAERAAVTTTSTTCPSRPRSIRRSTLRC